MGDSSDAFDISIASEFMTKAKTAVTSFWSTNQTAIMTILGVVVVVTLIWVGVKLFKRATGKA